MLRKVTFLLLLLLLSTHMGYRIAYSTNIPYKNNLNYYPTMEKKHSIELVNYKLRENYSSINSIHFNKSIQTSWENFFSWFCSSNLGHFFQCLCFARLFRISLFFSKICSNSFGKRWFGSGIYFSTNIPTKKMSGI